MSRNPLAQCPSTLFALVGDCPPTDPLPRHSRRHWPPEAHLLDWLLTHAITDWHAVHFGTLEALYDATMAYPTDEEMADFDRDGENLTGDALAEYEAQVAAMLANPWHLVLGEGVLPFQPDRLPVVPLFTHPFY